MKKLINKIKNKNIVKKLTYIAGAIILGVLLSSSNVFAASNTSSIDAFINFACDWLTKIGGIIALVGGVCTRVAKRRCRRKIKRTYDSNGWFYACGNCSI